MEKCVLCGVEIKGFGHNALPIKKGRCYNLCNSSTVIPARIND